MFFRNLTLFRFPASLRDALAECLWSGRDLLPVEGGGVVTLARLRERATGAGAS